MKNLPGDKKKRPSKELRDQLRRDEIVAAAKACVVRHGFHAASMGQIAAAAEMSVGQIYRYFPNKEAIVHAIVERIVAQRLRWMVMRDRNVDLAEVFANRGVVHVTDDTYGDSVLLLEITAEATRNPAVAAIVREADRRLHEQAVAIVRKEHPELSLQEATARVEFLVVLSEGTAFRRITEQPANPKVLAALYREAIGKLLPGSADETSRSRRKKKVSA